MSSAVLVSELKFCFRCRQETLHAFVGELGLRALYQCPCGAPPREITPREALTSAPRLPPPPPSKLQRPPAIRSARLQNYTNRRPMPAKTTPYIAAIARIVDEKLAESKGGLTKDEVVQIVRAELAAAFGVAAFECPRKPHRGTCGKKCRAAAAEAAA
jgi:hypothetical protein